MPDGLPQRTAGLSGWLASAWEVFAMLLTPFRGIRPGPLDGSTDNNFILGAPGESVTVSSTQLITSVDHLLPVTPPGGPPSANFTTTTSYNGQTGHWQLNVDFRPGAVPRADVLTYTLEDGTKGFLIVAVKSPGFKSLTCEDRVDPDGTLLLTVTYSPGPAPSHPSVSSVRIPHWARPTPGRDAATPPPHTEA